MPHWIEQYDVPSEDGEREYKVSLSEGGSWACSCRNWTTTYPRKDCKHIKAIKVTRKYLEKEQDLANMKAQARTKADAKKKKPQRRIIM